MIRRQYHAQIFIGATVYPYAIDIDAYSTIYHNVKGNIENSMIFPIRLPLVSHIHSVWT